MNNNKVGLALGVLLGGWHLVWAILVALGVAQPLLNWVYAIHFLNNPFIVGPFSLGTAVALVVVTFVVGYVVGWVFAYLWKTVQK